LKHVDRATRRSKYSEKLRDPRWQKKRLEILQRDKFCCQKCFDTETTLHVHHRRYIPGRDPWEVPDDDLVTLCEVCHAEEQELWPDVIQSLCETLVARGYFSEDVNALTQAIFSAPGHPRIFQDIICWLSQNPAQLKDVYGEWSIWVHENAKANT
jgi:hypothetical protein